MNSIAVLCTRCTGVIMVGGEGGGGGGGNQSDVVLSVDEWLFWAKLKPRSETPNIIGFLREALVIFLVKYMKWNAFHHKGS